MFDIHSYLRNEFHRYFPDTRIDVHDLDEQWNIEIHFTNNKTLTLTFNVGSDDDCFRFTSDTGSIFTVPIPPQLEYVE